MTMKNLFGSVTVACSLFGVGACLRPQAQVTATVVRAPVSAGSAGHEVPVDEARQPPAFNCSVHTEQGPSEFHRGLLAYSEPPRAMSVEAYRHVEFWLHTNERKFALGTSQTVTGEQLKAARDREVSLCCVWTAGPAADVNEAAPMGPDAQPLARPSRCAVVSLTLGTH
jgi:hypothetical protein